MLNIVIVNGVYPPEPVVSAQMGRDLAVRLGQIGNKVTVLCPRPSRPLGADYSTLRPFGKPLLRVEDGVEVVRLPSFTAPHSRLLPRMRESLSFGRQACSYLKRNLPDTDVVYANTWPLLSQALIARHCVRRLTPLVWHIKDLYPESLLTRLPRCLAKVIAAPLVALDRCIVYQARHTVVLSESLRWVYLHNRGLPAEKVSTVLDWVDEKRFEHMPLRSSACSRYRVPEGAFTFLYLGNIGSVAGVELLLEAFSDARPARAQLVIAGDGSAKAACVELARRLQARDVQFISDPDAENVPLLQSLANVCLLPLRRGAGMSSIPSKLMAYLLSGKPVLSTLDSGSDTARCIREAQCGWVGEPEDKAWLAAKMREVAGLSPAVLGAIGQRGRGYGLKHFSKVEGVQRLATLVVAAAANPSRSLNQRLCKVSRLRRGNPQ